MQSPLSLHFLFPFLENHLGFYSSIQCNNEVLHLYVAFVLNFLSTVTNTCLPNSHKTFRGRRGRYWHFPYLSEPINKEMKWVSSCYTGCCWQNLDSRPGSGVFRLLRSPITIPNIFLISILFMILISTQWNILLLRSSTWTPGNGK